jgi:hypothetical protein
MAENTTQKSPSGFGTFLVFIFLLFGLLGSFLFWGFVHRMIPRAVGLTHTLHEAAK